MTKNVEVTKSGNESAGNVIRKFSRRVQGTGIVRFMRGRRFHSRSLSKAAQKKQTLRRLGKQARYQRLVKEGKIAERPQRRHGRRG